MVGHVIQAARPWTFSWHVPLFFLLAGYLWVDRGEPMRSEVWRRWQRVLVPYAAWLTLCLAATWALRAPLHLHKTSRSFVLDGLHGGVRLVGITGPHWFLTAYAAMVAVLLVTSRIAWWATHAVCGALAALAYLFPRWVETWPLSVGAGVAAGVFVLAGLWLRTVPLPTARRAFLGAVLASAGLLGAVLGWWEVIDLRHASLGTPVLSAVSATAISIGIVWICEGVEHRIPAVIGTQLTRIAEVAVPIMCAHMLIAVALLLEFHGINPWLRALLAFAGAAGLGVMIARTPLRSLLV